MKKVFNSGMVAHVWAQQNQEEGYTSSRNFSFQGEWLLSYQARIARFITTPSGERVVLFSTGRWSNTTSKHQTYGRRAIGSRMMFAVPSIGDWSTDPNHETNLLYFKQQCEEFVLQAKRATSSDGKNWKARQAEFYCQQFNRYAEIFGLTNRMGVPDQEEVWQKARELAQEEQERNRERRAKQEEERKAARDRYYNDLLPRWLNGEDLYMGHGFTYDDPVRLRVKGDVIETTRGAQVPLEHARRLVGLIRAGREYVHNDHSVHVGHFKVDKVDAQGNLWVGCHYIERAEMERIAAQLGW